MHFSGQHFLEFMIKIEVFICYSTRVCPSHFQFPASIQIAAMTHDREELPLEFPDGTTPVTCPVSIYDGSTDKQVGVGSLMAKGVTPPLPPGILYMEEVHVKAYAVTSLMKIYAFEIAAGRKVDMLPECQSLIEELSAPTQQTCSSLPMKSKQSLD